MGKGYLKYDTEKMIETKVKYENYVKEMSRLQDNMQKVVDKVKEAWRTEAGDAFFEKYNNEWLKGFVQYQEVLSHMASNLDIAQSKYSEITRQANALKIK